MRIVVLLVSLCCFVCVSQTYTYKRINFRREPTAAQCVSGRYPPSKNRTVSWYTVNLDLPPKQRWAEVGQAKKAEIRVLINQFKHFIVNITKSDVLIKLVDSDLSYLVDTLPQPFQDELKGMATATGINLGEICLYNIFYEIFTVCTSIVAEDSNGKLYHARNLDFGLFMGWDVHQHQWIISQYLRPAIVNLNFTKNGKTLFQSVNFGGYIGILTAIKPGIFTLSMDERFNADGGYIGIVKWILGNRSDVWMGFLTRTVMETASSYENAVQMLSNTPMLAPAYFIVAGNSTGQACVITRARDKALDVWHMSTIAEHKWFILETNYDHWKAPMVIDNRRDPGNKCMLQKGQKAMNLSTMFDVLSSQPVLNKLTTYTALMQVNSGHLETYLQYCPDPCSGW